VRSAVSPSLDRDHLNRGHRSDDVQEDVSSAQSDAPAALPVTSCFILTEDESFLAAVVEGLAGESVIVRELHPDDLQPGTLSNQDTLLLDWREVSSGEKALRAVCQGLDLREPAAIALAWGGVEAPRNAPLVEVWEIRPDWSRVAIRLAQLAELRSRLLALEREKRLASFEVRRLKDLGHYDALTGFMARQVFLDGAARVFADELGQELPISLLHINLDGFRRANDRHGHWFGDQILRQASERLRRATRYSARVPPAESEWHVPRFGRVGADEFTLLLPGIPSEEAGRLAHELVAALSVPFEVEGQSASVTASIGIATAPDDGRDPGALLRNADIALYQAKLAGGDRAKIYTASTGDAVRRKTSIEFGLRTALERNELELYYQPRYRTRTGRITGAEALVRWNSPSLGQVSPGDFIPVAEDAGLIVPLGEWVMRELCRYLQRWEQAGADLRFSFNVSGAQLLHEDLHTKLLAALRETGVAPNHVELEVTESVAIEHMAGAVEILRKLQETGVHIALDDFGTGYSSLAVLIDLPLDTLKLDQSIVSGLGSNPDVASVAGAMIGMAHSLGLSVVAEGVETEGQLKMLRNLACDEIQGFYYSAPVPAEEFERLVRERSE